MTWARDSCRRSVSAIIGQFRREEGRRVAQHGFDDHHPHPHGHRHLHGGERADYGRAFAIGIGLNLAYVAAEAGFGVVSGSLALLADAGHNLGDVSGWRCRGARRC
jgi:hypothetical protein